MLRRIRQELKQGKTLLQFGILSATGQAFGMIAPLVVAKFFSSAALFGSYSLAKMIVFFFSTLLIASSQTPFIVFASQERAETSRINKAFSVQCTFLILGLCIFAGITIPLNKYVVAFAKIDHGDLLFVLLAFVGLALKTFLCNLFMAMGQRIKRSLAELVFGSLTLILVVLFYVIDAINLRTVFAVYFISALFVLLIFAKAIDINQLRPLGFDRQHFKDMFDFTKWVMLGATAIYFINWGDNLVLRFFASLDDIGSYNLGYQIFKGVTMLTFIIPTYFLPFVSQHIEDSDKIRNYLYNKRPKILAVGAVVIGLLFVTAPYAFKLVYGEDYPGSIMVLRILLIASVLILYTIFYTPILYALKKYKVNQIANLTQVLLNLLLDLLLVPVMGIVGAAVATVIAYLYRVVIMEIYFRLKLKYLMNL